MDLSCLKIYAKKIIKSYLLTQKHIEDSPNDTNTVLSVFQSKQDLSPIAKSLKHRFAFTTIRRYQRVELAPKLLDARLRTELQSFANSSSLRWRRNLLPETACAYVRPFKGPDRLLGHRNGRTKRNLMGLSTGRVDDLICPNAMPSDIATNIWSHGNVCDVLGGSSFDEEWV